MPEAIEQHLRFALARMPDVQSGLIVDYQGLVIAQVGQTLSTKDWAALVTAWTEAIRGLSSEAPESSLGAQVQITRGGMTTLIAPLGKTAFWALALGPAGVAGRAQFWMQGFVPQLQAALEGKPGKTLDFLKTV